MYMCANTFWCSALSSLLPPIYAYTCQYLTDMCACMRSWKPTTPIHPCTHISWPLFPFANPLSSIGQPSLPFPPFPVSLLSPLCLSLRGHKGEKRDFGGVCIHSYSSVLHCVAVILPCVAVCCTVSWMSMHATLVTVCCSVLQCVAVCCSVLWCIAVCLCRGMHASSITVCCSVLHYIAVCCSVLQCVAICCSVSLEGYARILHAVCCSVLQCIAVCCSSVLQCVTVCLWRGMHVSPNPCDGTHTLFHTRTYEHTSTRTHERVPTCTHAHTHRCARARAHTHTRTQYTLSNPFSPLTSPRLFFRMGTF